jgi:DNA-binding SARP family transcriptional activator
VRIYLTGPMAIESEDTVIREAEFPGRQGRLLFAYLVSADGRAVPRSEIVDLLWMGSVPAAPEAGIAALVSKLRALLARAGLERDAAIDGALGLYQLRLPEATWVDVLYAQRLAEAAQGALRRGDLDEAWTSAFLAGVILRRPFLAEEPSGWADRRRTEMRVDLVRSLEVMCDRWLARGEHSEAVLAAHEIIDLEPFRETGYQRLMRAHALAGNRAEALRVYARCRQILSEELGVDPSPPTESVYLEILRA